VAITHNSGDEVEGGIPQGIVTVSVRIPTSEQQSQVVNLYFERNRELALVLPAYATTSIPRYTPI
jgi:hypothetical protein